MSINASFGLLSSTGTQALQNFSANKTNMKALGTVSGYNAITGQNHGFYTNSIFSNSVGNESVKTFELTGMLPGKSSSFYTGGGFGTSLVGNYYNSLNNVGLGQGTPSTIFEQRLAYSMGLSEVPQTYYPNGNFSDEFSLGSTPGMKSGSASYDVFKSKDAGSSSLNLMS